MPLVLAALLGFGVVVILQIGLSPTVVSRPIENDCHHIVITQMFGAVTMVDSVVCGEQDFVWNGESLISEEDF